MTTTYNMGVSRCTQYRLECENDDVINNDPSSLRLLFSVKGKKICIFFIIIFAFDTQKLTIFQAENRVQSQQNSGDAHDVKKNNNSSNNIKNHTTNNTDVTSCNGCVCHCTTPRTNNTHATRRTCVTYTTTTRASERASTYCQLLSHAGERLTAGRARRRHLTQQ